MHQLIREAMYIATCLILSLLCYASSIRCEEATAACKNAQIEIAALKKLLSYDSKVDHFIRQMKSRGGTIDKDRSP